MGHGKEITTTQDIWYVSKIKERIIKILFFTYVWMNAVMKRKQSHVCRKYFPKEGWRQMARGEKGEPQKKRKINPVVRMMIGDLTKGLVLSAVFTVFAILIFAFVIKVANIDGGTIPVVNQVIKMVGVWIAVYFATKKDVKPGVLKGLLSGILYIAVGFMVMSLIGGEWGVLSVLVSDLGLGAAAGAIFALILSLLRPKDKGRKAIA